MTTAAVAKRTTPLTLDEVRERLRPFCDRHPEILRVAVFGSVARGTAHLDSDVDLLVTLASTKGLSLFDLAGLSGEAEDAVGVENSFVLRNDLQPEASEGDAHIIETAVCIYER